MGLPRQAICNAQAVRGSCLLVSASCQRAPALTMPSSPMPACHATCRDPDGWNIMEQGSAYDITKLCFQVGMRGVRVPITHLIVRARLPGCPCGAYWA